MKLSKKSWSMNWSWRGAMIILAVSGSIAKAQERYSKFVYPDKSGKLVYKAFSKQGDKIPDYSMCGYKGGGVAIPEVAVVETLKPGDGKNDDSKRIQQAIDKVATMRAGKGNFRGAVLLKKGKYVVNNTINIKIDGIVLRGEGQGEDGTYLLANGAKKYNVIYVGNNLRTRHSRKAIRITDKYVPIGAKSFAVDNSSSLNPGDDIILVRTCNEKWLMDIGMGNLTERYNNPKLINWTPKLYSFRYDRVITAIDGNKITINAPIVEPIASEYGGGIVYRAIDRKLKNCGVEKLRIISTFDQSKITRRNPREAPKVNLNQKEFKILKYVDREHAQHGVFLYNVRNSWVRNVSVFYTTQSAVTAVLCLSVTVQDCAMIDPAGPTHGGCKYPFSNSSQLCLFQRLYARNGRHDFAMGSRTGGPNVYLDCFADFSLNVSEPHHRYGHGVLYDNCILENGGFMAVNRGNSGSGHGWAGAMVVFWNCGAELTAVMKPPTSQNFSIGWNGTETMKKKSQKTQFKRFLNWLKIRSLKSFKYKNITIVGDGSVEYPEKPVSPSSLYLSQLRDRLGMQAVKNIAVPWQLKPVDPKFRPEIAKEPYNTYLDN